MREKLKKITAAGLSLCVLFTLLPAPALAVEETAEEPISVIAPAPETSAGTAEQAPAADVPDVVPVLTQSHVRYMAGFENGTFAPNRALTRAQAAQIVYRLLENPDAGTRICSYKDVDSGAWYAVPVRALCALGLFDDGPSFRPDASISRAEFVDLLIRLRPDAAGEASFTDVPQYFWAAKQIGAAAALGWINGYPDGTFCPNGELTRAQACAVINRMTGRTGDAVQGKKLIGMGLYSDVNASFWAADIIAEASVTHKGSGAGAENWSGVDYSGMKFRAGFHEIDGRLYYADRFGRLAVSKRVGAFSADASGVLTQVDTAYQMPNVPYISQIDNIYAWVGCEAVAALGGMRAKGYGWNVTLKAFLDNIPRSSSDPEKGFVGSPYVPDTTKRTRTTIYPAKLAEYCNAYCGGDVLCSDFRGASVQELRRELLAGNCVVAYETLWWAAPFYRYYNIEGTTQRLVSNNHAVLVCGYDPNKGYFISDPYNYYNRGQVHQYWENAAVFDAIWNERKVGMLMQ